MTFPFLEAIIVSPTATLADALGVFDHHARHTSGIGIVLVADQDRVLLGTATEGDVRRALIAGRPLADPVSTVMELHPTVAVEGSSPNQLLQLFDRRIRHVPMVNAKGAIVDLVLYSQFEVVAETTGRLVCARAPMRMSFAGGGSDLSVRFSEVSGAVVSVAVAHYGHAVIEERVDGRIRIQCEDSGDVLEVAAIGELEYDGLLNLQKAAIRLIQPTRGLTLRTYSDVPKGSGLGGSSTLLVATIGALAKFSRRDLSRAQIADLAFQAERIELEQDGGWQDQYAAAFGGLNLIEFANSGITVTPIALTGEIRRELESGLLLCPVSPGRDSAKIQRLSEGNTRTARPEAGTATQTEMAYDVLKSLMQGDLRRFGEVLTAGWNLKRQLGTHVATAAVDSAIEVGLKAGAIGGKLLGAGGGGHVLLFADPRHVRAVANALAAAGYRPYHPMLAQSGVEVWHSGHSAGRSTAPKSQATAGQETP